MDGICSIHSSLIVRRRRVEGGDGAWNTRTLSVFDVRVSRVLKPSSNNVTSTVTVIAPCSLEDLQVGTRYVVFAVAASDSWSDLVQLDHAGQQLYAVLGHPVPATRRVLRQVNDYVHNGGTHYSILVKYTPTAFSFCQFLCG